MLAPDKQSLVVVIASFLLLATPALSQQGDAEVSSQRYVEIDVTDNLEDLPPKPIDRNSPEMQATDRQNFNIEQN